MDARPRQISPWRFAARVAAASVALGVGIQAIVLVVASLVAALSGAQPTGASALAFLAWSTVACTTITVGRVALRLRSAGMAAAGAAAAVLGVAASLAVTWGVATAMAQPTGGVEPPLLAGAWKAVEYGALGVAIVALGRRGLGAGAHAGLGAAWGIGFGGAFLFLLHVAVGPLAAGALAARAVTELLFPIGCSLLLWWEGRALAA